MVDINARVVYNNTNIEGEYHMKIRKESYSNLWDYYLDKKTSGGSNEAILVESEMEERYVSDIRILQAIRDFCPLEYLNLDSYGSTNNKYEKWLHTAIFLNIFHDRETFTKDFCIIDIPRDTFCNRESDILINVLRRCGADLGLVVRRLDTHTLTSEWKKEYILDEEYRSTNEQLRQFDNKFQRKDNRSEESDRVEREIEENLIQLIREKLLNEETVFVGNNAGERKYDISGLVEALLNIFRYSLKMNIFVSEIYYRCGLPKQADRILSEALELRRTDDNTARKIKKIQQLVQSKKPKDRFRAIEEFTGEYFEDITGEHVPILKEDCFKDIQKER